MRSGVFALLVKQEMRANIVAMFEWSHGANNDLHGLFKDLRLYDFALICLVIFNMPHGPDRDEGVRHEQFKDMVSIVVQSFTPQTATLFRARSGRMLQELAGVFDLDPSIGEESSLWQHIMDTQTSNPMGDRVNMCQYMGWWIGSKSLLPVWTLAIGAAPARTSDLTRLYV